MEQGWQFGPFVLWAQRRRLERAGEVVRLGARAFDLLQHLLANAGAVVRKDEMLAAVWRGIIVEDGCLRVQMYLLRKALGTPPPELGLDEWIANVPTLGYSFVASAQRIDDGRDDVPAPAAAGVQPPSTSTASTAPVAPAASIAPAAPPVAMSPLPAPASFKAPPLRMSALVGRENERERVLDALDRQRLVSLVGAAGVGKTSLAADAVEAWRQRSESEVAFVDLSPLPPGAPVASALVQALGAPAATAHAVPWLRQALAGRRVLLLIDNCEQVVESLAPLLLELLSGLPQLRVLATSREALRVGGEYVLRLAPLACPEDDELRSMEALRRFPAVTLLHDRLLAAGAGPFDDSHAAQLACIVRQLDGIPLAIELVAAQVATDSLPQLARKLDNHMRLHAAAGRAGVDRHRTLAAALDWSLQLLSDGEIKAFRRLSVFRSGFDTESALLLFATEDGLDPEAAQRHLTTLVTKSLVALDPLEPHYPYRLLDTTRSYAESLLIEAGGQEVVRRRHVAWLLDRLGQAVDDVARVAPSAWGQRHARMIDDVRAALDWALSPGGDVALAVELTLASSPVWFHLSQVEEFCQRVQRAIDVGPAAGVCGEPLTRLLLTKGQALWHIYGYSPSMMDAFTQALVEARQRGDKPSQLQACFGLGTASMKRGDYLGGRQYLAQFQAVAATMADPAADIMGARLLAVISHFNGDFAIARDSAGRMQEGTALRKRAQVNAQLVDGRIAVQSFEARTLWLLGESDRALDMANGVVDYASNSGHSLSLCFALFGACPVALWSGDLERAEAWCQMMLEDAHRRGLVAWHRWAECFSICLDSLRNVANGDRGTMLDNRPEWLHQPHLEMLLTMDSRWLGDTLVSRAWCGASGWCTAEVWRGIGERHAGRGEFDEAEALYRKALDHSRGQQALAWEARSSVSLARLQIRQNRHDEAAALLTALCRKHPTVRHAPALSQARELLVGLGAGAS